MPILKKIFLLLFLICALYGTEVTPTIKLQVSGGTTDMVATTDQLFIATAMGKVDVFDKKTKQFLYSIQLEKIKDFVGDMIESKVYSVDVIKNQVLIVSQGEKGGRDIFIYKDKNLHSIIPASKRLFIAQAKFINETQIVFATLSNQIILYDIPTQKKVYDKQISQSKFSYFVLNEQRSNVIVADESGDLKVVDTKSGEVKTTLANQNLDNIFQVDWKNDVILTAGQDRRSVLYSSTNLQPYIRKSGFLIYGCALNKNGNLAAYSSDEQNNVTIYNTQSKKDLCTLVDNGMTITKILFVSSDEILIGTDDKVVNFYRLAKE